MNLGSLFSGYAGLDLATEAVLGTRTAWHADPDPGATAILDHHWPDVPNHGDITQVNWHEVEPVDVLTGGFPCQDVSSAGRRAGLAPGTRSGLWTHMARAISVLRPRYVIAENVRGLLSARAHSELEPCPWCLGDDRDSPLRALGAVLGDLAVLGYDAQWCGLRAADVGAPHSRYRVFVVATDTDGTTRAQRWESAPGQTPGRRAWADARRRGRTPAADPDGQHERCLPGGDRRGEPETPARNRDRTPADTASDGRHQGQPEPARLVRGPDVGLSSGLDWGDYAPAIHRWADVLGRVAPDATEPGARGGQVLSPTFVEWLMGLPAGHVTSVPGLSRAAQLKALGNGVVPQQATAALRYLMQFNIEEVA